MASSVYLIAAAFLALVAVASAVYTPNCLMKCAQGICVHDQGAMYCDCYIGWYGRLCDTNQPHYNGECGHLHCINGECRTHTDYEAAVGMHTHYKCQCTNGWSGQNCTDQAGGPTAATTTIAATTPVPTTPVPTTTAAPTTTPTPTTTPAPTTTPTPTTTPAPTTTMAPTTASPVTTTIALVTTPPATTRVPSPASVSITSPVGLVSTSGPVWTTLSTEVCQDQPGASCEPHLLPMLCQNANLNKICRASCGFCGGSTTPQATVTTTQTQRPTVTTTASATTTIVTPDVCQDQPGASCEPHLLPMLCTNDMLNKICKASCGLCGGSTTPQATVTTTQTQQPTVTTTAAPLTTTQTQPPTATTSASGMTTIVTPDVCQDQPGASCEPHLLPMLCTNDMLNKICKASCGLCGPSTTPQATVTTTQTQLPPVTTTATPLTTTQTQPPTATTTASATTTIVTPDVCQDQPGASCEPHLLPMLCTNDMLNKICKASCGLCGTSGSTPQMTTPLATTQTQAPTATTTPLPLTTAQTQAPTVTTTPTPSTSTQTQSPTVTTTPTPSTSTQTQSPTLITNPTPLATKQTQPPSAATTTTPSTTKQTQPPTDTTTTDINAGTTITTTTTAMPPTSDTTTTAMPMTTTTAAGNPSASGFTAATGQVTTTTMVTPAPCEDDPAENCDNQALLAFICVHPDTALKYCPRSCGLCPNRSP